MENISDKKKAIFNSTLELIRSHGFHGAAMSLIAKNADVAAGTIYHYFESKDQLICELYTYVRGRLVDVVNEGIMNEGSYKEKFDCMWQGVYEFYNQNPEVLIFIEQFVNSPYHENKRLDDQQDRPLYNFFLEGMNKGYLKNTKPEILLILMLSSIISTAKLNKFGNLTLEPEDLEHIRQILWDGMAVQ